MSARSRARKNKRRNLVSKGELFQARVEHLVSKRKHFVVILGGFQDFMGNGRIYSPEVLEEALKKKTPLVNQAGKTIGFVEGSRIRGMGDNYQHVDDAGFISGGIIPTYAFEKALRESQDQTAFSIRGTTGEASEFRFTQKSLKNRVNVNDGIDVHLDNPFDVGPLAEFMAQHPPIHTPLSDTFANIPTYWPDFSKWDVKVNEEDSKLLQDQIKEALDNGGLDAWSTIAITPEDFNTTKVDLTEQQKKDAEGFMENLFGSFQYTPDLLTIKGDEAQFGTSVKERPIGIHIHRNIFPDDLNLVPKRMEGMDTNPELELEIPFSIATEVGDSVDCFATRIVKDKKDE